MIYSTRSLKKLRRFSFSLFKNVLVSILIFSFTFSSFPFDVLADDLAASDRRDAPEDRPADDVGDDNSGSDSGSDAGSDTGDTDVTKPEDKDGDGSNILQGGRRGGGGSKRTPSSISTRTTRDTRDIKTRDDIETPSDAPIDGRILDEILQDSAVVSNDTIEVTLAEFDVDSRGFIEGERIAGEDAIREIALLSLTEEERAAVIEADEKETSRTSRTTRTTSTRDSAAKLRAAYDSAVSKDRSETRDLSSEITVEIQGKNDVVLLEEKGEFMFTAGSIKAVVTPNLRTLKPGRHVLTITMPNPLTGKDVIFRTEFYWGVLAMNTDFDTYTSGDVAEIYVGVLDNGGFPVCDATTEIKVTAPDGTSKIVPVTSFPENCKTYDSASVKPDYAARYTFGKEGEYLFELKADNGSGDKILRERITVKEDAWARVERSAATRLYPVGTSPMDISVSFNENFNGTITEKLPKDFVIISSRNDRSLDYTVVEGDSESEYKSIVWEVKARKGETLNLSYEYDAPDISPEFYLIGGLEFKDSFSSRSREKEGETIYNEQRKWEIANDNPINVSDTNLVLWLRADKDIYGDTILTQAATSTVGGWKDQTVIENNFTQTTAGLRPNFYASSSDNAINFHPVIDIDGDGGDYLLSTSDLLSNTKGGTFFAVTAAEANTTTWGTIIEEGAADNGNNPMFGIYNGSHPYWYDSQVGTPAQATNLTTVQNQPFILGFNWAAPTTTASAIGASVDGKDQSFGTFIHTTGAGSGVQTKISEQNGEGFNGRIAEMIVYQENLAQADVDLIESYLAAKYAITINQATSTAGTDYVTKSANGTLFATFDASQSVDIAVNNGGLIANTISNSTADDYVYDITMIGKDNTNLLYNYKASSQSLDESLVIEAESPSLIDNQEFIYWANNNASTTYTTSDLPGSGLPSLTNSRINREWRVQKRAIVANAEALNPSMGNFKMTFDLDDYNIRPTSATNFCLVTDTDSNFTTTGGQTVYCSGTLTTSTNTLEYTGVALTNGMYFMLAVPQIAPGGVKTELKLWNRADIGAYGDFGGQTTPGAVGSDSWNSGAVLTGPASSFGQSFTAVESTSINSILFYNNGTNAVGQSFTVSICNTDITQNTEAACISSPVYTESGLTTTGTGISTTPMVFKWTTPFAITAGSQYTIILTMNDSTAINLLYGNNTAPYAGGKGFGSGAWGDSTNDDFAFSIGGYFIQNWEDLSGNNNDAVNSTTVQYAPRYVIASSSQAINYNPAIDFPGTDEYLDVNGLRDDFSNNDQLVIYTVYDNDDATVGATGANQIFSILNDDANNTHSYLQSVSTDTLQGNLNNVSHTITAPLSGKRMVGDYVVGDTTLDNRLYVNGRSYPYSSLQTTKVTNMTATARFSIGQEWDSATPTDFFDGRIAEVIAFDAELSEANRNRVESYLALKYGLSIDQTVAQDYTASNGSTEMWNKDAAGASTYDNEIIGIGRDDGSGLLQATSTSASATGILTLGAETALGTDLRFLTLGSDGDNSLAWVDSGVNNLNDAPAGYQVLDGKWAVQENNGDVGTVKLTVNVTDTDKNVPNINGSDRKLYFIRDAIANDDLSDETPVLMYDDGTNGDTISGDGIWTLTGINFATLEEFTFAQKTPVAPAGVMTNLFSWYTPYNILETDLTQPEPDEQCTTNCTWYDASGNDRNATSSGNLIFRTSTSTNAINFHPTQNFDGGNDFYIMQYPTAVPLTNTTYFARAVTIPATAAANYNIIAGGTDTNLLGWGLEFNATGKVSDDWGAGALTANGVTTATTTSGQIIGIRYDASGGTDRYVYLNGKVDFSTSTGPTRNTAATVNNFIGQNPASTGDFSGVISEIIVWSAAAGQVVSEADIQKVDSYLAIKYGITLSGDNNGDLTLGSAPNGNGVNEGDYVLSDGSVVWDYSAQTGYLNDVFGIARDDSGALAQIKSTSVETDGIVTIEAENEGSNASSTFVDMANLEALMIGNDNASSTINGLPMGVWVDSNANDFEDAPEDVGGTTDFRLLARTWNVQETGEVGTVTISVNEDDVDFDIVNPTGMGAALYFIQDTDGDNTFNDETPFLMTNSTSSTWTLTGVDLSNGEKFTFAQTEPVTPGAVQDDIGYWFDANRSVFFDTACTVAATSTRNLVAGASCVKELSTNAVISTSVASDPQYNASTSVQAINYYPVLNFDGNDYTVSTVGINSNFYMNNAGVAGQGTMSLFNVFTASGNTQAVWTHADTLGTTNSFAGNISNATYIGNTATTKPTPVGTTPVVDGFVFNDADPTTSMRPYRNGVQNGSSNGPTTPAASTASAFRLGSDGNNTVPLTGNVPEVVIFKTALSDANRAKVESYFAIKYGITLTQSASTGNIVDSDGTIIWNGQVGGTEASYASSTITVGRDDEQGIAQIESISGSLTSASTSETHIKLDDEGSNGVGSFVDVANKEFLTIGRNTGTTTSWTTTLGTGSTTPGYQRVERTWKVREVGEVGAVTIMRGFAATANITSAEGYPYILIDTDADASFEDEVLGVGLLRLYDDATNGDEVANDRVWSRNGVDLDNNQLYTFAQKTPVAPGAVSTNLFSWYKADVGVYDDLAGTDPVVNGDGSSLWQDQSGNNRNTTGVTGNVFYQGATSTNAINYNPAIDFDGTDDFFTLGVAGYVPTGDTTYLSRVVFVSDELAAAHKLVSGGTNTLDDMWSMGSNVSAKFIDSWQTNDSAGATTLVTTKPYIAGIRYDAGGGTDRYVYLDGKVDFSEAEASIRTTASTATNYIGQGAGGTEDFDGRIAEVIIYSAASGQVVSDTEIQKIDSYLCT
jgi:hypothetical protein